MEVRLDGMGYEAKGREFKARERRTGLVMRMKIMDKEVRRM